MFIAGEASGDLLAAELVEALKQSPEVQTMPFPPTFFGAGGLQMANAGVALALDLTQHAVTGFSDVLKKYWVFKRIFDQLVRLAIEHKPDVIICVDFQGFNRRLVHAVRRYVRVRHATFNNWNPKIVQYVSPQVWASRPGRAYQLAEDVDLLLSIIPFEKEWYAERMPKLRAEFVGHPIAERVQTSDFRLQTSNAPSVLLLPGSRADELRRHLPVMIEAARNIQKQKPAARFKMVLPNVELKLLANGTSTPMPGLQVQVGDLPEALGDTIVAIASTGTVTLECALFGVPTVAIYKTSWSTYFYARQIVMVKHIAMPNLLANETIYPELIQGAATAENIAREALQLLNDAKRRDEVKIKLAQIVKSLGEPGASQRAAQAVVSLLR